MSWIKTIDYSEATGALKRLYDKIKSPNGQVDNVMKVHSLRPNSLSGHMALYKNVLHHHHNTLDKWYLELVGVYVSQLNNCGYCQLHHSEGMRKLLNDEERYEAITKALISGNYTEVLDDKLLAGMEYAEILTHDAKGISPENMARLRAVGFDDGQILELNQVVSYFNYVNRTVNGLGVHAQDEELGLSPSDGSSDSWEHK